MAKVKSNTTRIEDLEDHIKGLNSLIHLLETRINMIEENQKFEPKLKKFEWPDGRFEILWDIHKCKSPEISECEGCSDGIENRCNAYDVYMLAKKFAMFKDQVKSND